MSDFRAIGGVSATLKALLSDRMELPDFVAAAPVTIGLPPFSSKDTDPHNEGPRVNIFLYRVTENGYLQNQEIPGRGAPSAYGHPPLSLNLHYLITAYGNTELPTVPPTFDDTTAQLLLGSAMRVLHDVPVVTESVVSVKPPSGTMVLDASLRGEFEHVKLSIEPLTLEDITKVWTATALRFRLSASYVANVVQIESRRSRRFPRPVGQPISPITPPLPSDPPSPGPMVYVLTIQTPTVTDLRIRRLGLTTEEPFPYAKIGDTLVLRGTSLFGPATNVAIGELAVPASGAAGDRVEATIPDAAIPGAGPIPPDLQLQPGVHTVKVTVSDPLVPQSAFTSNETALMLVPGVDPALLTYAGGPPRAITIHGTRLISPAPGGETVIGRSAVSRRAYISATPLQLVVPIPDTLPARSVHTLIGQVLPPSIPLGGGAQQLNITIGGTMRTVTANLTSPLARSAAARIVAGLIHDAAATAIPPDRRFTEARVGLWKDRLLIVSGGLVNAISIASPVGLTFAADLGLTTPQPPGATTALVSGVLGSPPPLTSPSPRVTLTVGAQPPIVVAVSRSTSLAALADDLQAAINAIGGPAEYLNARVATTGSQLLIVPGAAGAVIFSAAPGDATTVIELQLQAKFAVRVRVNGAESIDPAVVALPQ
jgi:hypothetical protein